jgi:hypothetical protein
VVLALVAMEVFILVQVSGSDGWMEKHDTLFVFADEFHVAGTGRELRRLKTTLDACIHV